MRATAILLAAFASACSSAPEVTYQHDYDPSADFSSLKSYNWLAPDYDPTVDNASAALIETAVNNALGSKGFREGNPPDFLVQTAAGVTFEAKPWTYGRPGKVQIEETGTLILRVYSAQNRELMWQGLGRGLVQRERNLQERQQFLNDAVAKLVESFPPAGQ